MHPVCLHVQYPTQLKGLTYDPDFAIRGLHCDSKNGVLMKIDTYNHIQKSSVYRCVRATSPFSQGVANGRGYGMLTGVWLTLQGSWSIGPV